MEEALVYIADSRNMAEIADEEVGLVVTSPPYWQIKDYGIEGQIGHSQSLHEYLYDLARVWQECWRVLKKGRRLCINIGDQFARATWYGRYRVFPLHAEVIAQCESLGFDYMGAIIWQKKTTMRPSGGAVVMGSFPYPPNGIIEIDYEYILIFKKPGEEELSDKILKEKSALTREEWKTYFSGHWEVPGERQRGHEAMFPDEIPQRLIRMFSFVGDIVLDPFLGSGTTLKVALELGRRGIGYEIQPAYESLIREKLGLSSGSLWHPSVVINFRQTPLPPVTLKTSYCPFLKDFRPPLPPEKLAPPQQPTHRVVQILDEKTLLLEDGTKASLMGIAIPPEKKEMTLKYLHAYLLGKRVILRKVGEGSTPDGITPAYIYLKNKLFVNRKMIEMGLACADKSAYHKYMEKFIKSERHGK